MSLQVSYQFLLLLLLRLRPANTALHNNSCDLEFFEALWKEVLKLSASLKMVKGCP